LESKCLAASCRSTNYFLLTFYIVANYDSYLSECGTGGIETEYWNSIRQVYFRAISFVGMEVEEGYVA